MIGHTRDDAYEVKMKLYELEDCLPAYFCRVSKSTIANARAVYSLDKSFSGTSRISFHIYLSSLREIFWVPLWSLASSKRPAW